MEKHTINIDVNTQKANADVDKLDKNFTDLNRTVENLADTMDMDLGAAISEIEDQLTQLAVQGKQNTEEFKNLAKEAGRLKGVIADVDAQVEFFAATNADVGQKIGLLEDQMYRMAVAGDTTSAEFRKIQAEAAALKQSVIQVDMALDGMAMTTSQKLTGALGGVTGGFAAAQGAMASFGTESQAVNEAILKVQAAMALTQGVDAVRQAIPAFTALKLSVVGAFQGMTTASKAFALTGIGLVITGVALLVANFDKVSQSLGGLSDSQRMLNDTMDEYKQGATEATQQTTKVGVAFDLAKKGVISKGEALKTYNDTLGDSFGKATNLNDAEKLYRDKTDAYIKSTALRAQASALATKYSEARVDALMAEQLAEDLLAKSGGDKTSIVFLTAQNAKAEAAQKKADADKLLKLMTTTEKEIEINNNKYGILSESEQQYIDEQKQKREEAAQKEKEAAEQRAAELEQLKKDELAKITEAQNEYNENERTRYMTEQQLEIDAIQKKYAELLAIAAKYGQDNSQLLINQKNEENDINTKYEQERIAKEQEANKQANDLKIQAENEFQAQIEAIEETNFQNRLQSTMTQQEYEVELVRQKYFELEQAATGNAEQLAVIEEAKQKEIADIDIKYKEEAAAREQQLADMKLDAVQNGLSAVGNLAELFSGKSRKSQERAFKVQKAANIASATIDTYRSATAAFNSFANIPIIGTALGAAAAAAAVAAGLVNIKKIASTKFEGGEGGSVSAATGAGNSMGSVTSPEFNIVGGNTANQLATLGQQPVQAYVVSGEVSSAQSLDRNRVQNATL